MLIAKGQKWVYYDIKGLEATGVFLCMNVYVHMGGMCLGSCTGTCVQVCVETRGHPQECWPPPLGQDLLVARNLLSSLGWLTSKPEISICLHLPGAGITDTCPQASFFMWVLGTQLGSSCLRSRHFMTDLSPSMTCSESKTLIIGIKNP